MKRWMLVIPAALLGAVVAPAIPAMAATTTTVDLVSGTPGVDDFVPDPTTDVSVDGGASWSSAANYAHFQYFWDYLPGTDWVVPNVDPDVQDFPENTTVLFRRVFELPAGSVGSAFDVCLHADNSAVVTLDGTQIGAQEDKDTPDNFWGAPQCYSAPGTLLHAGQNTLEFAVHNFGSVTGVDYHATATYSDRVNTPPVLQLPGAVTVNATGPQGAVVDFTPAATDDTGATVSCEPAPGSILPIGTTTVTCVATDDDGATATGSFPVTVRSAREQLADLLVEVTGAQPGQRLEAQIRALVDRLPDRSLPLVCEPLRGFIAAVNAMAGHQISRTTAAQWVADASRIRAVLGCR